MKRAIKVMNNKPEITDDEIRSYMNFEKLIAQEKTLINKSLIRNGIVLLAGIIAVSGLWLYDSESKKENAQQSSEEEVTMPLNESPAPKPVDTVATTTIEPSQKTESKKSAPQPEVLTKKDVTKNTDTKASDSASAKKDNTVLSVFLQAEPVDGYPALYEYFARELTYPAEVLKDSVQGVVTVVFTINTSGKPEKLSIEQSLGPAFDKEATRVIMNMPAWKPATYNGKPMSSRMSVPLTFQITKTKTQ